MKQIYSACDLFSLNCGVLTGEIMLNSTCLDTKSYMQDNNTDEVFVYISSDASLGLFQWKVIDKINYRALFS